MDAINTTFAPPETGAQPTWWERTHPDQPGFLVAYFSMEFGLDESLPIYSGGLGVLAGDHLKAAAELGIPLVGAGLLYRDGYFRQRVGEAGRQVEELQPFDPEQLLALERTADGAPLTIDVELAGEPVPATVWRADVGRVTLYLLDAGGLTDVLYGGDREHRIRQELLLGVGGVRALAALGLRPSVFHVNEGHSAFLTLERVRALIEDGVAAGEALERVRETTVFTTHTPVPAGNEVFPLELVRRYVAPLAQAAGLSADELLALGRTTSAQGFGMTPFALRLSARANGVSALHGHVARRMWSELWPERERDAVPIGHVTNGVHPATWLSPELVDLLREAGVHPRAQESEQGWERVRHLDPAALWRVHRQCKARLVEVAPGLDPDAFTIAFARRFATYKRAGLLFADPKRLLALLGDPDRPVQVVIAGKAHPADEGGKDVMQRVVAFSREPRVARRVVFLEDYDMGLARRLVQGADVWLNTPRRPHEASGTSGMKAAMNGVLNVSTLDGWWAEAADAAIGWTIGGAEVPDTDAAQDAADAEALYRILEDEVVPAFYDRDEAGVPVRWVETMRASIERVCARFGMQRVLVEYVEGLYLPAHRG